MEAVLLLSVAYIIMSFMDICSGSDMYRCPTSVRSSSHYKTIYGDQCFIFVDSEKYWDTAQDYCQRMGGDLLKVKSAAKMRFIKDSLATVGWTRNGVWLGAHDRIRESHWQWTTGEPVTWSYWASGQPRTLIEIFSFEDCAVMLRKDDWRWYDRFCHFAAFHYNFICEFRMKPRTTTTSKPTTMTTKPTTTTIRTTPTTTIMLPPTTTSVQTTTQSSAKMNSIWTTKLADKTEIPMVVFGNEGDLVPIVVETGDAKPSLQYAAFKKVQGSSGGQSGAAGDVSLGTDLIAGVVIGALALIMLVSFVIIMLYRRRKNKPTSEEPVVHFQNMSYSQVNQADAEANHNNIYLHANEVNSLYEEVQKETNYGLNNYTAPPIAHVPTPKINNASIDVCKDAECDETKPSNLYVNTPKANSELSDVACGITTVKSSQIDKKDRRDDDGDEDDDGGAPAEHHYEDVQ